MGEIMDEEKINGIIKDLQGSTSSKYIDLIITNKRLLLIRTKSALIEPMKGRGIVGITFKYLADKRKKEPPERTLNELLMQDPKNQSIPLESLEHVKLKKGWLSSDIWIILKSGKKWHLGINSKKYYDQWKPILKRAIPDKLIL